MLIFNIVESVEGVEAIFAPWEKASLPGHTHKKRASTSQRLPFYTLKHIQPK